MKPGSWGCEADSGRIWKELHKRLVRTQYQQISLIQLSFSFGFLEMLIGFPLSGYGTKYQSSKNTANKIGGLDPEPPQPWESEAEPAEERPWYVPIPRASGYRVQCYRSFKCDQLKTPFIYIYTYIYIHLSELNHTLCWWTYCEISILRFKRRALAAGLVPGWTSLVASPKRSASTKWPGAPGFSGIKSWRAMVPWGSSKKIQETSMFLWMSYIINALMAGTSILHSSGQA